MCVGGPALIYYVTPTEEQLFLVCPLDMSHDAHMIITTNQTGTEIQPRAPEALPRATQGEARRL